MQPLCGVSKSQAPRWGTITPRNATCVVELIPNNFSTCVKTLITHPQELLGCYVSVLKPKYGHYSDATAMWGVEVLGTKVGYYHA